MDDTEKPAQFWARTGMGQAICWLADTGKREDHLPPNTTDHGQNNGVVVGLVFFYVHDCKHDILDKINPVKDLTWEDHWWKAGTGVLCLFAV